MFDRLKDRVFEMRTGFTMSPHCFLPMLLASEEEVRGILSGEIPLKPMVEADEAGRLAKECAAYQSPALKEAVLAKSIVNLADLHALYLSLIPLVYRNGQYVKPSGRLIEEGEFAIILLEPQIFLEALNAAIQNAYPNLRILEVATAQYNKKAGDIEKWDLFARPPRERWKNEIFAMARIQPNLNLVEYKENRTEFVRIGDISGIVAVAPTMDLVRGCFPKEIYDEKVVGLLDACKPAMSGIQGYLFSVAANVMEIKPVKEWIDRFRTVFSPDEWICNTVVDKLFADGASMPRLSFYHVDGTAQVYIGINRIEFRCAFFEEKERSCLRELIVLIDQYLDAGYCHMVVETNANLGTVRNWRAFKTEMISQSKTYLINGLENFHKLETDYNIKQNILGIPAAQRAWHYTIQTRTPNAENIMWYTKEDVLDFFEKASAYHSSQIAKLMKGNIYARYQKI